MDTVILPVLFVVVDTLVHRIIHQRLSRVADGNVDGNVDGEILELVSLLTISKKLRGTEWTGTPEMIRGLETGRDSDRVLS